MALFEHSGISKQDVSAAASLARTAYKGNPIPADWTPLYAGDLGFSGSSTKGSFSGYYFNSGILAPGGSAVVLINEKTHQLVVSFRGSDDSYDKLAYATLGGNSYIDRFAPLLDAVTKYLAAYNDSHVNDLRVLVTGHSLGGAAANILRDVSLTSTRYSAFADAAYVTFATPKVAANSDILNVGFENDGVFKYIGGYKDYMSTTDNIVVFDDAYASTSWPGTAFDLNDTSVHAGVIYEDVVNRVIASSFYEEMGVNAGGRDAVVVVVNTNLAVTDKAVKTSNHFGQDAYYIGRDGLADKITGGTARDTIEGFGGNDTLAGGSGADRILGGVGLDTLNGGAGNDRLLGGFDADTLTGGTGNDTFRFNTGFAATNIDRITDFDVNSPTSLTDSFDVIELERGIFTRLEPSDVLDANSFARVSSLSELDSNGRLITYVSSTGALYYDSTPELGGSVQFATLGTRLALTSSDFLVTTSSDFLIA